MRQFGGGAGDGGLQRANKIFVAMAYAVYNDRASFLPDIHRVYQ